MNSQRYPSIKHQERTTPSTRRSENIEANVEKPLKIEFQSDFEDVKSLRLTSFLAETFASKPSSSAKNTRRGMFCISKTLYKLSYSHCSE